MYEDLNKYWAELNHKVIYDSTKYIIPIFHLKGKSKFTFFASGVLLTISNRYFLVSAHHVLDEFNPNDLVTIGKDSTIFEIGPIGMRFHFTDVVQQSRTDIEIFELGSQFKDKLDERFDFLEEDKLLFNEFVYTDEKRFSAIGFPAVHNKNPKYKGSDNSVFNLGVSERLCPIEYYSKFGYSVNDHILINYPKKSANPIIGNEHRVKEPKGMSGGALFYFPQQFIKSDIMPTYFLAGILIERNLTGRRFLAASKIYKVLNLLEKGFKVDFKRRDFKRIRLTLGWQGD